MQPADLVNLLQAKNKEQFHLAIVSSFGRILSPALIRGFRLGVLNIHASLLPQWRGPAPIPYTLLYGCTTTGVSLMRITPDGGVDTGGILCQESITISDREKRPQLIQKLGCLGNKLLDRALDSKECGILNNCLGGAPQSFAPPTYSHKITAEMFHVDWQQWTAVQIDRLSRALLGVGNLIAQFGELPVKLDDIDLPSAEQERQLEKEHTGAVVGQCVYLKPVILVKCKVGWISFGRILIGRKVNKRTWLSADDFHNGYLNQSISRHLLFQSLPNPLQP